jgi:DNA-directed RNA polymerase specialized sigma24 family protein
MKKYINHQRNLFYKLVTDEADLEFAEPEFHMRTNHSPKPENEAMKLEVHQLAENMPTEYKNMFRKIVDGYHWEEIAQQMQISKGSYFWKRERMVRVLNDAWSAPLYKKDAIIKGLVW